MRKSYPRISLAVLLGVHLAACGRGTGTLTFVAANTASVPSLMSATPLGLALAKFDVCIKKIQLEDESGEAQQGESEENEIEFKPGLVDLKSVTTTEAVIGTLENAPVGFKISKIKIKVRKDESLCGSGTHSIDYNDGTNSAQTDNEIEFKWKFNPAVELEGGDTVQLAFGEFVTALTAIAAGTGSFGTTIPNAEGTARIKNR